MGKMEDRIAQQQQQQKQSAKPLGSNAGLRQKLLVAKSEEEITRLLEQGRSYEFASPKTQSRWIKAAHKARTRLGRS